MISLCAPLRLCAPSFVRPFVCAPLRLCAPSFVRPFVCAVLCFLLLALLDPPAQAGHYAGPTYGGGNNSGGSTPGPAPTTYPDASAQGGWGGGNGFAYGCYGGPSISGSASCGGPPITATYTWVHDGSGQNDQNDPPPAVELVEESCDTNWQSNQTAAVAGYTVSGTYKNPLGGTVTSSTYSGDQKGVKYSVQGGATLNTSETISCSATGSGGPPGTSVYSAVASVNYGFTAVSPITIDLAGGTSDGKGGWDILVGQKAAPFLYGIPSNFTVSNYQWTVSGTTMQNWTVSSDSTHTTAVPGSGPLNIESPVWFWNDPTQTNEKITCTATITPPAGQGSPFPVTVSQTVGVYLPTWLGKSLGGQMTVDAHFSAPVHAGDFCLYANPSPNQPSGMTWEAKLAPPQSSPVTFDKGNIYLVQVITPSVGYADKSKQQWNSVFQGQLGIDTAWPYGWSTYEDDPDEPYYVSGDSPGLDLTNLQATYGYYKSSFEDYIMYQPPDSPEYVPLGNFKWSVNGTATIPSTNNWANFQNPAGTVQPSGVTNFTPDNTYPSWTQNSGNTAIAFKKL